MRQLLGRPGLAELPMPSSVVALLGLLDRATLPMPSLLAAGLTLMADPLLSCSDRPVCYGDWKVLRGHIAGESHRLRHSFRALCIVETGDKPLILFRRIWRFFWRPSARVAMWMLLPLLLC